MKSWPTAESPESFPTQVWGLTRNYEDRDPAVPTENAYVSFVVTDKEELEFPTENAQIQFSFREDRRPEVIQGPPPSEAAEAEFWLRPREGAGARVPGRYTRHLLDVTTHTVTAAAIVWGPKVTLELTDVSHLPGWMLLIIVTLQIGGVMWFGRGLVRQKR